MMAHSRKKLVTEYKGLLREKIQRIQDKEKSIVDYITDVSKEALDNSKSLLHETDKKLFLKCYQDVSSQLEVCMNTLLMVSSRLPSKSTDSTTSSSSNSSESDDDDEEEEYTSDKHSGVTSLTKSSQSSHHSQKSPYDSKNDKDESDKYKKDGKKVGGGDSKQQQLAKSQRKDQEFYQSPKGRSLLDQFVHVSPRHEAASPKHHLRRSQSYEHLKTSDKSVHGRSPRHHSSPSRLMCKQPASLKSAKSERKFQSGPSGSSPKSPKNQRRSPAAPDGRLKFPSRHSGSLPYSKSRSPSRRYSTPSGSAGRRSPQPKKNQSRGSRFQSHENEPTTKKSDSAAGKDKQSEDVTKTTASSASPRSNCQQLQHRKMSPSPERKAENSRWRSPPNHPRYQAKATYTKHGHRAAFCKKDSPWYACSSPPRSRDLMKDYTEEKKHRNLEKSRQPLVIPTEELDKLRFGLETPPGIVMESHGSKSIATPQVSTDITTTSNKASIGSAPAKEVSHEEPAPSIARQTMPTGPPGLQIPSALQAKSLPHAEMTSRSLKNTQRQVTSSPSGNIQITVKDSGVKAAPSDITAKLRSEPLSRPREPPGLAPLTKLKGASQVSHKTKGPREVFPEKQVSKTAQPANNPAATVTHPQQTTHQIQRTSRPPQQTSGGTRLGGHPVAIATQPQQAGHPQRSSRPQQQTPGGTRPGEHPEATVTQPPHASHQQRPSHSGAPSTLLPAWKPILTHGSVVKVLVTDLTDPGDFFVQPANTPLQQLMMDINKYMGTEEPEPILNPICGSICLAQWITVDQCWYRAAIKSVAPAKEQKGAALDVDVGVIFIDYGNKASVPLHCIKALDQRFQDIPPQAMKVALSNVKPIDGIKWTTQALELFRILVESTQELKVFCAKVTVTPGRGKTTVDLSFKEAKGHAIEEINIASELVQHGVAEFILPPPALIGKLTPSRTSKSSSDDTGNSPQLTGDVRGPQTTQGQPQQYAHTKQQSQHSQSKGSSTSNTACRSTSDGTPAVTDPTQQTCHQQSSQTRHVDSTPRPQRQEEHIKQESKSSVSQGGSVASNRKVTEVKQQPLREQKQPQQQQQAPSVSTKARAGMTLAQTIAAQAAETFHDDARSECSSRSTGSMQTARGTSSTTSMKTAYDGGSGSATSQGSRQPSRSQQSRGPRKSDSKMVPSETAPKKSMKQPPQLAPRQLSTFSNDSIQVAMSHIVHPHEFYVHLISPEIRKLDFLQEELKYTYEEQYKDKDFVGFTLDVGMMGVSKYSLDEMWYRIKVLTLEERTTPVLAGENKDIEQGGMQYHKTLMVQINFVDFGNTEWVPASAIKPLHDVFFGLPAQAIKCSLAHIQPEEPSKVPHFKLDSDKPSTNTQSKDENSDKKNYCEVCCHQAKNTKEYNDHLTSNDHLLADKMARFCEASEATVQLETQSDHGGWTQVAIDIFKQLAPCENHRMLGMLVKQVTDEDEAVPLILSYHEGAEEICINQVLVNLGVATSKRFQKKVIEVPEKKETNTPTNRQLSMAMETWNMKESGYQAVAGNDEDDGELSEVNAMDNWDPKTSDYYSERNSMEVDDEDITAAVGYSHTHDRKFCRFYMKNQKCYRGDQCPYEHPQPGEDLRDCVPVFYAPTNHSPALPIPDGWVAVEVTALYNAFHFWVQLPWGKTDVEIIQGTGLMKSVPEEDNDSLHGLEKTINECCKVNLRTEDPNILRALGEVVIAKYSRNKRWYRARVIDYDETEPCLKVFYVDYGNAEWLPRADVRTPKPEFLHLPFQAVECSLYGVAPIKGKEELARRNLEPLVMDKIMVAHVVSSTEATNTMEIQLFNTNGKHDISISQYLLQHNFATEILDMPVSRAQSRPRRMPEHDEPDSVSCHEIEIPG